MTAKKGILIIGGTGLIGQAIVRKLDAEQYNIFIASRNVLTARTIFHENHIQYVSLDEEHPVKLVEAVRSCPVIINLAGENIGVRKWTEEQKNKIYESRLKTGALIDAILVEYKIKPEVYIQASAIGYYGNRGVDKITEKDSNGKGFLAEVCDAWESSAWIARHTSKRSYLMRIGLVLSKNAELVTTLSRMFKYFGGVRMGYKNQMISWIHIDDLVQAVISMLDGKLSGGEYNLVSPNPEYAHDFYKLFAKNLKRLSLMSIPPFLIKMIYGQMADELLLSSQNVFPEKLLQEDFSFKYTDLNTAFKDIL